MDRDSSLDDLAKPVKSVEEKWKLLPYFLRIRVLMRQHIDSFNNFTNDDDQVVPKFFLRFTDIYVMTYNARLCADSSRASVPESRSTSSVPA
jgi:DNA-directed RNA polymerase beta subunit